MGYMLYGGRGKVSTLLGEQVSVVQVFTSLHLRQIYYGFRPRTKPGLLVTYEGPFRSDQRCERR